MYIIDINSRYCIVLILHRRNTEFKFLEIGNKLKKINKKLINKK